MRDIERIEPFMAKLTEVWKRNPDFRLGQLLVVIHTLSQSKADIFDVEEDELLIGINELLQLEL